MTVAPRGTSACLRSPSRLSAGSLPRRRAYSAVMAAIGDEQLLVQHQLGAGRLGHRLDRAVVVGRPEAAGGDDEVVTGQLAQSRGDLVVPVAHDADAR